MMETIKSRESPLLVTVVIVAWNSGRHLQRALDALSMQTFESFRIFIWDNASQDGSIATLNAPDNTTIHLHTENIGFAAANNLAIKNVSTPYVALLNPDAFPEPTWLDALISMQARTGAAVVASLQLRDDDPGRLDGAGDSYSIWGIAWRGGEGRALATTAIDEGEVFAACAAAALYDRETFVALGGFDDRYFCYFEDVDYCFRLQLIGGAVVLAPEAIVRHVGSTSLGRRSYSAMYYGTRNRIFTFVKNMPLIYWPLALPIFIGVNILSILLSNANSERRGRWNGFWVGLRDCHSYYANKARASLSWDHMLRLSRLMAWSPVTMVLRRAVILRSKNGERRNR